MLDRFRRGLGSRSTAASRKQQDAPEALRRDNDKLSTIVSEKLDEGDIRGAVRTACSSDIIASFNSDSFEKMKGKRTLNHMTAESSLRVVIVIIFMCCHRMSVLQSTVSTLELPVIRLDFDPST